MHALGAPWVYNVSKYAELVTSYHGCSIPILKNLIREQKKYDLIFIDTAHELDSLAELALVSCLANENCLFTRRRTDYTKKWSVWLMSLKYNFAFPKFFQSRYTLARTKNAPMPLNFKANTSSIFEKVSEITDHISGKLQEGCKIRVSSRKRVDSA